MSDEPTVERLGDYEILGGLGAGGMGKVYKVRNVISDRIEAMKILLPDLAGQKQLADRFLREIKLLASLTHPNIASLRTALTLDNQLVMIMEFVEGVTLAARVEQGPIPSAYAVDYIDQVLLALSYAHRQHIIHRDIKPANMMLTPQGLVKLMDFGIARSSEDHRLTATGAALGSLHYMSPEQIRGETVDARADLYSVGVSLYEMVTGRCPFEADSNYSIMTAHLQQPPRPPLELQPDLTAALNEIILRALAKEPAKRFQSADAFRNALENVPAGSQSSTAEAGFAAPPSLSGPATHGSQQPTVTPLARPAAPWAQPPAEQHTRLMAQPQVQPAPGAQTRLETAASVQTRLEAVPDVPVPPPVPKPAGYRGLYMTLGALLVVALLVVVGVYGPLRAKGGARQASPPTYAPGPSPDQSGPALGTTSPSTANPASSEPASDPSAWQKQLSIPPSPADTAVGGSSRAPKEGVGAAARSKRQQGGARPSGSSAARQSGGSQPVDAKQSSGGQASQATADSAELDDLEHQLDQLSSRAGAVKDSLDTLRRQQQAQGYNLRGDIAASEENMETYLGRAQAALQSRDARKTKQYLDEAETEVEKLEKFLGR